VVSVSANEDAIDITKSKLQYFSQADSTYKTLSQSSALSFDSINQLLQLQVIAVDTFGNEFSTFPSSKQSLFTFALTGDIWTTANPITFEVVSKFTNSLNV